MEKTRASAYALSVQLTLLALVLAAAPERTSVAVIGFRAVEVSQPKVDAFAEVFADVLANAGPGLKVTSASAISAMIGLERQRELLGCNSDRECLSELVGALGPKVIVSGTVVKVGSKLSVSVRAAATSDGHTLFGDEAVVSGEDDVVAWLKAGAQEMAGRLMGRHSTGAPPVPIAAGAVCVAGLATAITFFVLTGSEHQAFIAAPTLDAARPHAATGGTYQAVAWTGAGLATAGAVALLIWWLWPAGPGVALAPAPGGALFSLGGAF
jgi:hypothetical protein